MLWTLHVLIMLFSSPRTRKTAVGIWMWIEKMEAKTFLQHRKMLFISLGKWKCQSENEIYGVSSLFWVMIRFYFFCSFSSHLRRDEMLKRIKALSRYKSTTCMMIYASINVTVIWEFFLQSRTVEILEMSRTKLDTHLWKVPRSSQSRAAILRFVI